MAEHSHPVADPQEQMASLLNTLSSYIEQYHGGWVKLDSFDGKILKVKMGGACEGCALTQTTLKGWIAGTVRQFFPEIEQIEAV